MPLATEPVFDPPFVVTEPMLQVAPVVFNAPHSGRDYPPEFVAASQLDALELRRSEDAFVDLLTAPAVSLGAPLLHACFPRAFLDLNREPWELDPEMFSAPLPAWANTRSPRVAGGLGTIPRVVAEGRPIWRERLPPEAALHRIDTLYKPYHRALRRLLARTQRQFGVAVLVDCHSMPSTSTPRRLGGTPDIVLGDRYGSSCAPAIMDSLEQGFVDAGYRVTRNAPYAGGFITEHYGAPLAGRHAVQVEINRSLYMDEQRIEPGPGWAAFSRNLLGVFAGFLPMLTASLPTQRLAAE
ncbi:N-formylglutamate amidohydrolase [Camelimonas lactis]|uniref:N-formylglutamate amidohydrolase n=1 Tax=Camelimonas lactis TaxID=659006 RepID=A0A4R2GRA9_9HYPH|nr:N-formylglutamate amidohydrolase [Camelimonas lactis]